MKSGLRKTVVYYLVMTLSMVATAGCGQKPTDQKALISPAPEAPPTLGNDRPSPPSGSNAPGVVVIPHPKESEVQPAPAAEDALAVVPSSVPQTTGCRREQRAEWQLEYNHRNIAELARRRELALADPGHVHAYDRCTNFGEDEDSWDTFECDCGIEQERRWFN